MDSCVLELFETGVLQRVAEARIATGCVAVALAGGHQVATAALGHPPSAARAAPVGCIAKLLTATLACRSAERGRFALDAGADELLGADIDALHGVSVRHLLEHTHGLDDSLLAPPPRRCGVIDRQTLVTRVAALDRWAPPGACYSYGHAGAWIVGAVLERAYGRALAALVRDELGSLGVAGVWSGAKAVLCAASGTGLALTADALARFGLRALQRGGSIGAARVMPLPGWHPLERGVCLGWKYAGAGWFGHQSVWPGASIYLRVQPQRSLALAVVARDQPAALAAIGVFGDRFPELFERRTQLPDVTTDEAHAVGDYVQAARIVTIESTAHGLCSETWERDASGVRRGSPARAALVPTRGVLFARPATDALPYVEIVTGPNHPVGLWNGRTVLRRAL